MLKVQLLQASKKQNFDEAADRICAWAGSELHLTSATVDRMDDSDVGSVDVSISNGSKTLGLSIKHNNDALKHPRPYSLVESCGYATSGSEDLYHRSLMEVIDQTYRREAAGLTRYTQDNPLKNKMLASVVSACVGSLKLWSGRDSGLPQRLFDYLVPDDCYQIVVSTRNRVGIKVHDYRVLPATTSVRFSIDSRKKHFMHMEFNNGFTLRNRLHTASSEISSPGNLLSLKFDVRKKIGPIPIFQI